MLDILDCPAQPVPDRHGPGLLARVLCIRFAEVALLQAAPILGLMFGGGMLVVAHPFAVLHLLLASLALVTYVFCLNDWTGVRADLKDPHKAGHTFVAKGITTQGMAGLTIGLGLASVFLFSFFPLRTLLLACALMSLGLIYSLPGGGAKGVPLLSSAIHVLGGIAHFLMGYSVMSPVDGRGLWLGLYFGLVFAAGHLNQEVRDYESDRINRIQTNAVRFGRRRTFLAGVVLFSAAHGLLAWLVIGGQLPRALLVVLLLFPIHVWLSWRTDHRGLDHKAIRHHQMQYRLLHAIIGVSLALAAILTPAS